MGKMGIIGSFVRGLGSNYEIMPKKSFSGIRRKRPQIVNVLGIMPTI
jgi:hypothetical protein